MFDKPQQPIDDSNQPQQSAPNDGVRYQGMDFGPSAVEAGKIKPVNGSTPKDTGVPGDDVNVYEFQAPATQSKVFLILAIIIGVVIIVGGVWWAYTVFGQGKATTSSPATSSPTPAEQPEPAAPEANPFEEQPTTPATSASTTVATPVAQPPATPVTSPVDSDKDGLSDTAEVQAGTDPGNPDSDSDDLNDKEESVWGTDPLNPDTDGDTFKDGTEVRSGYNPLGAGKITPGVPKP